MSRPCAQDQLAELQGLSERIAEPSGDQVGVFTYDGDALQHARRSNRTRAHLVRGNPDMAHWLFEIALVIDLPSRAIPIDDVSVLLVQRQSVRITAAYYSPSTSFSSPGNVRGSRPMA